MDIWDGPKARLDAIIITCALTIFRTLVEQLKGRSRMVLPVGLTRRNWKRIVKRSGKIETTDIIPSSSSHDRRRRQKEEIAVKTIRRFLLVSKFLIHPPNRRLNPKSIEKSGKSSENLTTFKMGIFLIELYWSDTF